MAVTPTANTGAQPAGTSGRRMLVGLNVVLNVILALILLAFVLWAADRFGGSADLSTAGVNSLSPRTRALLARVDEPVRITALYSTALQDVRPFAEKRQQAVRDLLDLYENAGGGNITPRLIDSAEQPAAVRALLERLSAKPVYAEGAGEHEQLLSEFSALVDEVTAFMQNELQQIEQLGAVDPRVGEVRPVANIKRIYEQLLQQASDTLSRVGELLEGEIAQRDAALNAAERYLEEVRNRLLEIAGWMTSNGVGLPGIGGETRAFFQRANERAQELLTKIPAWLARAEQVERPELENLLEELQQDGAILVETEDDARVLRLADVWPARRQAEGPGPDDDPRRFAGEQAISSAILRLTQDERAAVVFVRFGGGSLLTPDFSQFQPGAPPPAAPFGVIANVLDDENFITREWDVQTSLTPPVIENAAETIYVVLHPLPIPLPQQQPGAPQQLQRINPEQIAAVRDAVESAGRALFLVEWSQDMTSMVPRPEPYAYDDYLRSRWGINAETAHLALEFLPNPEKPDVFLPANQRLMVTSRSLEYGDHPIARELRGLTLGLPQAVPLREAGEVPEGVTLTPLLRTRDSEDVWAFSDPQRLVQQMQRNQGVRPDADADIFAPFAVAYAAERGEARLAVIAGMRFIVSQTLSMAQLTFAGGGLQQVALYPGNAELFVNTLHWLSGDTARIAVGPRDDVPRLTGPTDPTAQNLLAAVIVGGLPAAVLLAGAIVWIVRRS